MKISVLFAAELKRPRNSYTIFMQEISDKIREDPEAIKKYGGFMEAVAGLWGEMSGSEKERYVEKAKLERQRYEKLKAQLLLEKTE